jgi:hypothetical protein
MESLGILASGVVHDLNNVRSGIVIIGSFFNGFKILAAPCLKSLTGMMFAELTMTPPLLYPWTYRQLIYESSGYKLMAWS